MRVAAEHGVTGTTGPVGAGSAATGNAASDGAAAGNPAVGDGEPEADEADEVDEPLPPLHQRAYDAIEAGDLAEAVAAYEQALVEQPGDQLAKIGLAQVRLLQRTAGVDAAAARAAAAASSSDVEAAMLVADLDIMGGHVDDGFARLVESVRGSAGAERDRVRARLLELFEVVGSQDPRVGSARLALTNALF